VKNFSLSLYAFHLRQTLDDPPDSCDREADRLWENLTQFGKILNFPELKNLKSQLISYTPNPDNTYQYTPEREETLQHEWITHHADAVEFTPIPTQAGFKLTGNLQAFRLHDTYCADLTLYPESEDLEIAIEQLSSFQPHHLVEKIDANLGKFFWLTGCTNRKLTEIADRWANTFCANIDRVPQFIEQGRLFHADSFLYEAKGITILISLTRSNKAEAIQQSATDNYTWFRDLLWSRQKIIFAHREARECYQKARTIYSQLETKIKTFQTILHKDSDRISKLNILLKEIPQSLLTYKCYLRDLKAHYTTLETNAKNFSTCLIHVLQTNDSLKTWTDFAEKICPHYLTQIATYLNYLEPGKDLFTDLTNIIRATVEIERAQSDRLLQQQNQDLQDNIQAIGVGIATGAIIASSSGLITQPMTWPWNKERGQYIHPFLIAVMGSLGVAAIAWKYTKWILQRKRKRVKNKESF
jgi:hypothetical protein